MAVHVEGLSSQYIAGFEKWRKVIYNQMTEELDDILAWMGQLHSEAAQVPEPYSSPAKRPRTVSFDDVIVHFSEEQWKGLKDEQKEVYKNTLTETYDLMASLGSPIVKPEILLKLERGEEPYSQGSTKPKEDGVPEEHCTADQYINDLNKKLNATRPRNPETLRTTGGASQETLNPTSADNVKWERTSPVMEADYHSSFDSGLHGTKRQDQITNVMNHTMAAGMGLTAEAPLTRADQYINDLNLKLNATKCGTPETLSTTGGGSQETFNPMRADNLKRERISPGIEADYHSFCDTWLNGTKQRDRSPNVMNLTVTAGSGLAAEAPLTRAEQAINQSRETSPLVERSGNLESQVRGSENGINSVSSCMYAVVNRTGPLIENGNMMNRWTTMGEGPAHTAGLKLRDEHILHQRRETLGTGGAVKQEPQKRQCGEGKENVSPRVSPLTLGAGGWGANGILINTAMANRGQLYNVHCPMQGTEQYGRQVMGAGDGPKNIGSQMNALHWNGTQNQMFFAKMNNTPLCQSNNNFIWQVNGAPHWQVNGAPLQQLNGTPPHVNGAPLQQLNGTRLHVNGAPLQQLNGTPLHVNGAPLWQVNGAPLWQVNGAPLWQVSRNPINFDSNRQDNGNVHRLIIGQPNQGMPSMAQKTVVAPKKGTSAPRSNLAVKGTPALKATMASTGTMLQKATAQPKLLHTCTECGKSYSRKLTLTRHQKSSHPEIVFSS